MATRLNKAHIVAIVVVALVVGAVAGVFTYAAILESRSHPTWEPPSDNEMIGDFQKRKEEFVALLEMYQTDPTLEAHASGLESEDVSGPRLKEYLDLRQRLGVLEPIGPGQGGGVEFTTSGYGFMHGWAEGYLYSVEPPAPLVDNISESEPTEEWGRLYRHIEGDWYLYYGWSY